MRTFLHVGSGLNYKDRTTLGFNTPEWKEVRFDIDPRVEPDIVGTMLDMSGVASGSVDALFSSHNIEHIHPYEVPVALREFLRVLNPNGFVIITCPDLQAACAMVAEDKLLEPAYNTPAGPIAPIDMIYGMRRLSAANHFMAHKSGFTRSTLVGALNEAGFAKVFCFSRPAPNYDIYAVATKSAISDSELGAILESHFPGILELTKQ
jgi:predicted SAM-dependent methyltransferase